jgi:hypothetical protein
VFLVFWSPKSVAMAGRPIVTTKLLAGYNSLVEAQPGKMIR